MNQPQRHKDTELEAINPITERIIGCAIEVHRVLRCGLFEATYRSALAIEFAAAGLSFAREVSAPAMYKGHLLGSCRIDFIVEDGVIVEVKSVERMNPVFETQVLTYPTPNPRLRPRFRRSDAVAAFRQPSNRTSQVGLTRTAKLRV